MHNAYAMIHVAPKAYPLPGVDAFAQPHVASDVAIYGMRPMAYSILPAVVHNAGPGRVSVDREMTWSQGGYCQH